MKTYLYFSSMILFFKVTNLHGQLPLQQSFESTSGYTADVNIIDNLSDYFARMNTTCVGPPDPCEVNFTMGYAGYDGTYYWAGEDHDDAGVGGSGATTLCLSLDAIDISASTSGTLNISIMAAANATSNAYDPDSDGLFVTYSIDGAAFLPVHTWMYYTPDGGLSEFLAYDANNNGVIDAGETDILTRIFEIKSRDIAITGNSIIIQICAHSNSSSEEWAVDNIIVSESTVAPVELISFRGERRKKSIFLEWETLNEVNNQGFEIEMSSDGTNWEFVDFVSATSKYGRPAYYTHALEDISSSQLYFRLKQIDLNGDFNYLKTILIRGVKQQKILVSNIVSEFLHVNLSDDIHRAVVIDQSGNIIKTQSNNFDSIPIQDIPQGIYYLQIECADQIHLNRFIRI